MDLELNKALKQIKERVDEIFLENKLVKNKDEILDIYFKIMDFLRVSDFYCDTHRLLGKINNDDVIISYNCLDASKFILETINESIYGITFFSATLYPITYYMDLLTKGNGKYLQLQSPFDPNNLQIIINKVFIRFKSCVCKNAFSFFVCCSCIDFISKTVYIFHL